MIMKKRALCLVFVLAIIFSLTACNSSKKLEEIANRINDCESVKNLQEYGYEIKASSTKDTLTITSIVDNTSSKVDFVLDKNILSNENLSTDDLLVALLLINGVGRTYGYEDGALSQNINTFPEENEYNSANIEIQTEQQENVKPNESTQNEIEK